MPVNNTMKQKRVRDRPPPGVRHTETTRDERIKVLTLRDDARMGWTAIGRKLGIDRRTVQKVIDLVPAQHITNTMVDISKGKGDRNTIQP
jgi:DNA invertase Pin-like site-specific DNA recombinase